MQACSTTILPVAQLVERETVRVALYLEVACSTQALENPFVSLLIFFSLIFPRMWYILRVALFIRHGITILKPAA